MLKRFIKRLLGQNSTADETTSPLRRIPLEEHGVRREQISACALHVTDTLQQQGYLAFVVGGAIRDLMIGARPKDFDVATNATPEQVRGLFRRAHIIGRRFRLVHVMCGNDTVEVSTFRAHTIESEDGDRTTDTHGRILRDNVFGGQESDAERRDFTINALYYDPQQQEIWDYCGGVSDIRQRLVRMIGDPATRYREDPVRMLRCARFAAKLDFHIEPNTRAPIAGLAGLLANVPPARLFDEMLKLLLSGHAVRAIHQLRAEGLHHGVMPMLDQLLDEQQSQRFVTAALHNTDQRVQAGKPVSPAFLFASLLWHPLQPIWQQRLASDENEQSALFAAMDDVLEQQRSRLAVPRRLDGNIKEIWAMQPRFLQRGGGKAWRLVTHPRFRAGYDFLLLRAEADHNLRELADWWTAFYHADDGLRDNLVAALTETTPAKKRRRRKKPSTPPPAEPDVTHD